MIFGTIILTGQNYSGGGGLAPSWSPLVSITGFMYLLMQGQLHSNEQMSGLSCNFLAAQQDDLGKLLTMPTSVYWWEVLSRSN